MFRFYYVDKAYVDFLRTFDAKVPMLDYDGKNKFFCGIVLKINNVKYYAPVSHDTKKQRASLIIYQRNRKLSSIKFAYMIPVEDQYLTMLDFKQIAKIDPDYANLLSAEYAFCRSHIKEIHEKAESVYKIGCNKDHFLHYVCCDFSILETQMHNYTKQESS